MPKKIYKIDQFHGGLNTHSEWRDIADNELSKAIDVMVNHIGKIKLLGGFDETSFSKAGTLISGYGLYTFSSDWTGGEDGNDTRIVADGSGGYIAGTNAKAHYILVYDNANKRLNVYSRASGGGWQASDTHAYVFPTANSKPVFYKADGVVRFSDGLSSTYTGTRKWYGHIFKKRYKLRDLYINDYTSVFGGSTIQPLTVTQWDGKHYYYVGETALTNCPINSNDSDHPNNNSDFVQVGTGDSGFQTFNTWLLTDAEPQTPTSSGIFCYMDGSGNLQRAGVGSISVAPTPGSSAYPTFEMSYASSSTGNGWNKEWDIAYTWIYDGTQESGLKKVGSGVPWTSIGTAKAVFKVYLTANLSSYLHARITGLNIYIREVNSDTYYLQAEVDLYQGIKDVETQSNEMWYIENENSTSNYRYRATTSSITSPSFAISYATNTGLEQENEGLSAHYKTAVVTNRMAYIGNIVYKQDGVDIVKEDAMMKSFPNRFDTFTKDRFIEASVNDGDSIVKLEVYADRILQFKTRKMHLINISQELEFLEDTFVHKGIDNPNASCQTDFGIAWVNQNGCYFYNGRSVENLFEKKGRKLISSEDWASFYVGTGVMIGYLPKERQLIIVKNSTGDNGDIYLYDFITQSWVYGDAVFTDGINKTNITTDYKGDLWVAKQDSSDIKVIEWSPNSFASNSLDIRTKDIDFGFPNTRKKIYKIYITHKNAGSNKVRLRAEIMSSKATSGQPTGGQLSNWGIFGNFTEDSSGQEDNWITDTFIPPTTDDEGNAINWSNVYSMRLYISPATVSSTVQTVPSGFEINDINIVYRPKSVK